MDLSVIADVGDEQCLRRQKSHESTVLQRWTIVSSWSRSSVLSGRLVKSVNPLLMFFCLNCKRSWV